MSGTFRAPMRSRANDVAEGWGVDRALRLQVCGMGGRLDPPPLDLGVAVIETEAAYGARAAARLRRFAEVLDGAVVWTRTVEEVYFRGILGGSWRYDDSRAAAAADLVHVRPCTWTETPDVPTAVREAFARGGRNFQRIRAM